MKHLCLLLLATVASALPAFAGDAAIQVAVNKPDAIFAKGEEMVFSVSAQGGKQIRCTLIADGGIVIRKVFAVDTSAKLAFHSDTPSWVRFIATLLDADGKPVKDGKQRNVSAEAGAMTAPEEIRSARQEPADFDEFWARQRAELNRVPIRAELRKIAVNPDSDRRFDCYDVKIDCAGGKPVSGYLTMPKNAAPGTLPIVVYYHGAGVRSANPTCRAGAIFFDVNAHGIENGKPQAFYAALEKNELRHYWRRGESDRDQFYFRGMILRVMRALDYVKTRPEWDGKRLAVYGSSQGGGQAIAAAALDRQVTLAVAAVPAFGDHAGRFAKPVRQTGWPFNKSPDTEANLKTASYYDTIFFAGRIRCEIWLATGFIDTICAPTGVYAIYNHLGTAQKHIQTDPFSGHRDNADQGRARLAEYILPSAVSTISDIKKETDK